MLESILEKEYQGECQTTVFGTECLCKTVGDDFLHVLFAGITLDEKKHLIKELKKLKKDGPRMDAYLDFLTQFNGAILYAGSINLFGYPLKRKNEDAPASLIELNKNDQVSKALNQVIYIGNMPSAEGGNINIYFNVNTGLVTGFYKGDIRITWANIKDFIDKIIARYEQYYLPDGVNKNYGTNDTTVYNNMQKFMLKSS